MTTDTWLAISACATFALALVATAAIVVNVLIRNKDIDREHKARSINEVCEWVKAGTELFSQYIPLGNPFESEALSVRLENLWAERDAIVIAAENFSNDFAKKVKGAADEVDGYFKLLGSKDHSSFKDGAEKCERYFIGLFRYVTKEKAKLKL